MGEDAKDTFEPLVFRGRLTEDDVADIRRCHDRVIMRPAMQAVARGAAIMLAMAAIGIIVKKGPDAFGVLLLAGCLYLLFVLPAERVWRARLHYRRHAHDYLECEVRLSHERVGLASDRANVEFEWNVLGLIADSPAGLLFCSLDWQVLFWLPARLFDGNSLRECVLLLAKAHGVPVRSV